MPTRTKRTRPQVKLELQVNGELWRRVPSLDAAGPDDRVFTVRVNADGTVTLAFGDGEHGARLPTGANTITATYDRTKHFATVVMQEGHVVLDHDWNATAPAGTRLFGLYRGVVTDNLDPLSRNRLRVQVPDVLGNQEVWAVGCVPVGSTALPGVGQAVWIAFERGDPNLPIWVGTLAG